LGAAGAALAWGHFEAGWVRLRTLAVDVPGLPARLDGLRIIHLSDLHLGVPSRGERAVERAVAWTQERRPDLVLVSGDLLSRARGASRLRRLLGDLPNCYAVLGNHDFGDSRDPLSAPSPVTELGSATVLFDDARTVALRGGRAQIVGVDPRSYHTRRARPERLVDPDADLRILLCHFPGVIARLPPGAFHLVLAGHVHAGQITLPYPGGRLRFSQLRGGYVEGVYRHPAGVLHVSPGLGTTFVPFRFLARPEATELVLHPRLESTSWQPLASQD
jgi:predicted MPP superfamily phosphohydrolase